MATTGEILREISLLDEGATAQNHLLSGLARVKLLGLNLSAGIESLQSNDNTEVNTLDLETMTDSNSTLKAEAFLTTLSTNISC